MASFLGGLLTGLGNVAKYGAAPLANTVASHNFATIAENDKQRQLILAELARERQDRIDADNANLKHAQEDYYNRGRLNNGVKYLPNGDGTYTQVPTSAGSFAMSSSMPPVSVTPQGSPAIGGVEPPKIPQQPIQQAPSIGVNTGIKVPSKPTTVKPASTIPGTPEWEKAQNTLATIKANHRAPTPPAVQFLQSTDANGDPVYAVGDKRTRTITPTTTPARAQQDNATNDASRARLQAAVSEMNNADPAMSAYEAKLANKTANISGLNQFLASVGNTFTHDDPASMAKQTAALSVLNNSNPELARYIRRGLSFAEGESMVSQRPSDFRTRMAAFLSTAATGASPEMIQDIQSRRHSILAPLNGVVNKQPGGRGGANQTGGPPGNINLGSGDPEFDALMAKVKKRTP